VNHRVWTSWTLQPVVVALILAAGWAYVRGLQTLWRGDRRRGVTRWQAASFAAGLLVMFVTLVSPLHSVSAQLLWVHMVQHVLLVTVAAPLLVLGAPLIPAMLALPLPWRRRIRSWGRVGWIRATGRLLSRPLAAWLLFVAALWAWHAPGLYDAAARSDGIHALEHITFIATAILFWWVAIRPASHRHPAGGTEVLYVFTAGVQSGALGAILTFAGSPLYPAYARTAATWGLTPLQDQQLAGLIMWIPAGLVYMAAAGALFVRWLVRIERDARRAEGRSGSLGLLGERT
jgi:putative membrane protein